jgi:rubrerythrin
MGPVDTRKILGLAIELEMKTSECYGRIGKMPGAEPFADDLGKLAKEEIVHANLLRSGKSFESSDPGTFGRVLIPVKELEGDLEAAGQLIADIDSGKLTLAEAVRRIRDLEIAFERTHLATLLEINDDRLRKLFRALSAKDAGHQIRLQGILRDLEA